MQTVTFEGNPYQLGFELGARAKAVFADYIINCHHFTRLLPWRDSEWLANVDSLIENEFPRIRQELKGLADGCGQEYLDILLWNCRGDLLPTGPEGCTSIGVKRSDKAIIAHNEDGDPNLKEHCFLLDARLDNGTRVFAFAYPGSIPGHTICANSHGLVYTVNNIRLVDQGAGVPRMLISRALLEAENVDAFTSLLRNNKRSGGFHYTVADTQNMEPMSVEAPFQAVSVLKAENRVVHANHLVHPSLSGIEQIITQSSQSRQERMENLIEEKGEQLTEADCFEILQDRKNEALPVFRTDPDDPDEENTLATGIFTLTEQGVGISVYTMDDFDSPELKNWPIPFK